VSDRLRLFLLSFLLLYVELVLIRWTAANVLYLSYFTNFVLLGSFLGIGLGFLRPRPQLFAAAPLVLGALLCFVYFAPTKISHEGGRLILFGAHTGGVPIWVALPVVFLVTTAALMLVAGAAAAVFVRLQPLTAYRFDILGSIAGTATFALMSLLGAPPLVVPLALASFRSDLLWSPYYAIKLTTLGPDSTRVSVNGIPHQQIAPLAEKLRFGAYYEIPYRRIRERPRDVLVIGAGDGTDVSLALTHGARRVDAVEIDPRLLALGRERNVDRPYADPRVHTHVTDGRAFLERTSRRFDLIVFALPDSLTLVANQSSLRLESYLFTKEAFAAARDRLKPGRSRCTTSTGSNGSSTGSPGRSPRSSGTRRASTRTSATAPSTAPWRTSWSRETCPFSAAAESGMSLGLTRFLLPRRTITRFPTCARRACPASTSSRWR